MDDDRLQKIHEQLAESLVKSGLANRAWFDRNRMKFTIDWTPDGQRFYGAVIRAYELIAQRKSDNPVLEISRLVAFVVENR